MNPGRRRRRRRLLLAIVALVALLVLVVIPAARAADVFGNVAPASQLPDGALADAYPLSRYQLDHHFDAVKAGVLSGVDVSGLPPTIAWLLASIIWQLTALLASVVITLFTFAFSLDLVNGSAETGGSGALAPVAEAVESIYRDVFGAPWMTVAVLITGMWAIWNALVRRRYTETAGALGMSVLFVTIALAFVAWPERTIGTASRWTNQLSGAFLSLSSNGTITDHDEAKREVGDQLFKTLVLDPWVVLNFGGLEHCVRGDSDESVQVRPFSSSPGRDAALARRLAQSQQIETDNGKTCINHATKYAPHFLRFAIESDQRDAEHEALRTGDRGKLPDEDPGKRDGTYQLGDADKPAAEAMGKGGQYERLGLAIVILLGELGAFLLLGSLSVAVIVAQVLVLLLLAFAPIALVAAVVPRRGHEFFAGWLQRLVAFLLRKAIYSLVLAVLLAVAAALARATGNLGWLMAFGLQAVFFWSVFLNRRQLTGQFSHAITGTAGATQDDRRVERGGAVALYAAARLARRVKSRDRRGGDLPSTGSDRRDSPSAQTPVPPVLAPLNTTTADPDRNQDHGPAERHTPAGDAPDQPLTSPRRIDAGATPPSPRPERDRDAAPAPAPVRVGDEATRNAETAGGASSAVSAGAAGAAGARAGASSARPSRPPEHDPAGDAARHAPDRRGHAGSGPGARATQPDERRTPLTRRAEDGPPRAPSAAPSATSPERRDRDDAARPAASENPLLASLRHDARRLHHDARRLHEDAQQLAEHDPSPPPARRPSAPTSAPGPRQPSKEGDRT